MASTSIPTSPPSTPTPSSTKPNGPTFETLPPELRLQIYTHHLHSLLATLPTDLTHTHLPLLPSKLELFNPALLSISHAIRNELYPLYLRALTTALGIVQEERLELERRLYEGRCFEWDQARGYFEQGVSGMEVWGRWLGEGIRCQGLERPEGGLRKWVHGEGSKV